MTYTLSCCDDSSGVTVGTIVRFDNVTILIDPSWRSSKVSHSESIRYWSTIIPEVDIILISQPSVECLGAYGLLYYNFLSHFISRIEVYATLPVSNIGRVTTIEYYASEGLLGPFNTNQIDIRDVENAFDHVQALKYSQLADLRSKYDGLTLVAYSAGVSPGGCVWCISTYSEKLVYAFRWNHTRSTILNGSSLLDKTGKPLATLARPSAIITKLDRFGSSKPHGKRVKVFKDTLKKVLSSNGSALIPAEIGCNFLDIFVIVHDFLYESSRSRLFTQVPILLVAYSRGRVLTYAKSMLEWLSSSLLKIWESRDNRSPFELGSRFHVIAPEELTKYSGPKICFVSQVETLVDETLSKLCQVERTTVLLTSLDTDGTRTLSMLHRSWDVAHKQRGIEEGKVINYSEALTLKTVLTKPIVGEALEKYITEVTERSQERKRLEENLRKDLKLTNKGLNKLRKLGGKDEVGEIGVEGEEDEDEEDEEDEDGNLLDILKEKNSTSSGQSAIEIPVDYMIQPTSQPKNKMFPFQPVRLKSDDYGTFVDFNSLLQNDDEELDRGKSSAANEAEDDEDPYDLAESTREIPKKTRREGKKGKGKNKVNTESSDNIDYLDPTQSPVHRTESTSKVTIKCSLAFVNLESLVDQRSASIILPALKPRKVLLMAPPEVQNTQALSTMQKREIEIVELSANKAMEFIATIKSLDISIDPDLDALLKWQKIGESYTVAHVIGRLLREKPQPQMAKSQVSKPQSKTNQQVRSKLVLKPLLSSFKAHVGGSLSIGDVRLAELKRRLTEQHHRAEFKGEGTLVVDGQVVVRKIRDSETVVDGSPSELFYEVKKCITDMLAKI